MSSQEKQVPPLRGLLLKLREGVEAYITDQKARLDFPVEKNQIYGTP
jgi:hypothetical protein